MVFFHFSEGSTLFCPLQGMNRSGHPNPFFFFFEASNFEYMLQILNSLSILIAIFLKAKLSFTFLLSNRVLETIQFSNFLQIHFLKDSDYSVLHSIRRIDICYESLTESQELMRRYKSGRSHSSRQDRSESGIGEYGRVAALAKWEAGARGSGVHRLGCYLTSLEMLKKM